MRATRENTRFAAYPVIENSIGSRIKPPTTTNTWEIAALIKADRALLSRIEENLDFNPDDPTVAELKRIVRHRIARLQSELRAEANSTEDELQLVYNCLFLNE